MKRLLDKLLARQARLVASLGPESPALTRRQADPTHTLEEEQQAIKAAFAHLAEGDHLAAEAVLVPYECGARDARTLTTLSRLHSMRGDFEAALALMGRADALDASDTKVAHFMAELLQTLGRHQEAIHYRRRAAFSKPDARALAYVKLIEAVVKGAPTAKALPLSEVKLALRGLEAAPDTTDALRMQAAQAVFAVPALRGEGIRLCTTACPCPGDALDSEVRWTSLLDVAQATNAPVRRIADAGSAGRRPMMAELSGVLVDPRMQWSALLARGEDKIALSGLAARQLRTVTDEPLSPLLLNSPTHAFVRLRREPRIEGADAVLVGGGADHHDNLLAYVGSMAIAEAVGLRDDCRLVVNDDLSPQQLELLQLLGYGNERLLRVPLDTATRFECLAVTSRLAMSGWVDPLLPAWYRRRLVRADQPAPSRKLCVLPSSAGRRIANDDDVKAMLEPLGYEPFDPTTATVRQQIDTYASSTAIVTPSGSALANLVFAAPGTRVTIVHHRVFAQRSRDQPFDGLISACRHTATVLESESARLVPGQRLAESNLLVDLDALRAAVN